MGVTVISSRCLCHFWSLSGKTPRTLPLLQHEGSSHRRQFPTNFSNVSPSHRLQLFLNCPSVGPFHGVQSFRNRLLQPGYPMELQALLANLPQRGSPTGSQALPANLSGVGYSLHMSAGPGRSLFQRRAPRGVTASFWHPRALAWGPFHKLQVAICSTMHLHRLQQNNLVHYGLHHKLQGKAFCSSISGTSSPLLLQ